MGVNSFFVAFCDIGLAVPSTVRNKILFFDKDVLVKFYSTICSENIYNIGVGVNEVNVLNPVTSQITMVGSPKLNSSCVNCIRFDCQEEGLLKPKTFLLGACH